MGSLPVAFAATLLLRVTRVVTSIAGFSEVTWEMLLWSGSAVGQADMVTIGSLVSASHCQGLSAHLWTTGCPLCAIGLELRLLSGLDFASHTGLVTNG